jgi:ribosomal protein S18 acetylase RimI-like enzyme
MIPQPRSVAFLLFCFCHLAHSFALATVTSSSLPTAMNSTNEGEALLYRPLEATTMDQDIVWQMLLHAAHEDDVAQVKTNPLLQPYAQSFGHQQGDLGIVATTTIDHSPVGAAWVRALGTNGFASAHLKDDDVSFTELKTLPELAIACLPDHRGKGIGSSLLKQLLESARRKKYPGICLSCRTDNAAMKLYERIGFVIVPGTTQTNRVGGTSVTMKYMFDGS